MDNSPLMRLPAADPNPIASREALRGLKVTWLGHATLLVVSPKGVRVLVDPFLTNNPSCPVAAKRVGAIDLMLVTHGHADHCEDAVAVARDTGATVVASPELSGWLERQGVKHLRAMNIGGRQQLSGLEIAMVPALHSSSAPDGAYLGPATGFVMRFENGLATYFAGDTALFGDMRLIRDRYAPEVAFLAHRRSLHDGARRCGDCRRVARSESRRADTLRDVSRADRDARGAAALLPPEGDRRH